MNFRDLLTAFCLSAGFVLLFNVATSWWKGSDEAPPAGVVLTAESECAVKPLRKEVDFDGAQKAVPAKETEVRTNWANLTFTTDGATLSRLGIRRTTEDEFLYTIVPTPGEERVSRCFLLALDQKTPYFYRLTDGPSRSEGQVRLTYEADSSSARVRKTFIISEELHKIDVEVEITSHTDAAIEPRLFFSVPTMPDIPGASSLVVVDRNDSFEKTLFDRICGRECWPVPKIFGADQRYFAHVYIGSPEGSVQRGYTSSLDCRTMMAVLEGPADEETVKWTSSFYMGPKEMASLNAVDPRLEQVLEYSGWFAPISLFMLKVLKWLDGYVHNFGLAILLLTLLIKLLMLPLGIRSEIGMKGREEFQKKMDYLQRKYKDDQQRLAQERAELIKKYGLPGLGGCLPMFLQIPIFYGLSRVLSSSIELYQTSFLWIPDLSAKDPYYILPALLMLTMLAQTRSAATGQQLTSVGMAVVFGAMMASFSAGLVLYIVANTFLSVLQTKALRALRIVK